MEMTGRPHILVTGGAGYIGSHSAVALHQAGFTPVLVDNLDNSSMQVVEGVRQLCNDAIPFFQMDIRSADKLSLIFDELQDGGAPVQGILHFAAHKAVGESVHQPAKYASNNIGGLGTLLEVGSMFLVGVNQERLCPSLRYEPFEDLLHSLRQRN